MKKTDSFIIKYKFHILAFFAIFVLIFTVFYHISSFGFIAFDDVAIIMNNISKMDSFSKTKEFLFVPVFEEVNSIYYRPLLNLSFAIDTIISGGEIGFYHYSNILMHILATFLIFIFLIHLGYKRIYSLAFSLLFAVYPCLLSAIVWVPGRNDILLGIFVLFSMIFFIQSIKTEKNLYFLLLWISLMAAFLIKETAVIIPLIFIIYILLFKTDITFKIIKKLIFIIISVLLFYILLRSITISQVSGSLNFSRILSNILNSFFVPLWYLGVISFTGKIYLFPQINISLIDILKALIPLFVILAFAFIYRKKINFKIVLFGLFWYMLFLLPTLFVKNNLYLNHRLYIPIIGFFIIILETMIIPLSKNFPKIKKAFFIIVPLLILSFAYYCYKNSFFYKDQASFWIQAFKENPKSSEVNRGIAKYYTSINNLDLAENHALKAHENEKFPKSETLIQAGDIYFAKKDFDKAYDYYERANILNKYNELSYIKLSEFYLSKEDNNSAMAIIEKGIELMPGSKILQKQLNLLKTGNNIDSHIIVMKAD